MPEESVVFDQAAGYYDETRGFPPGVDHEMARFLASAAGLRAAHRVVEIGVGTGRIALPVAKYVGLLVGVDLSTAMMRRLLEKHQLPEYAGSAIHVVQGDVMRLPLASDGFDAAIATHIFHLIPSPEAAAAEVARVLKPGGLMLNCRNRHQERTFEPMLDAWDAAVQDDIQQRVVRSWSQSHTLFADMGWPQVGDEWVFQYHFDRTPAQLLEQYRRRVFSSLWSLSDEMWQRGVQAMEAAMQAHYPNPHEVHHIPGSFVIQIYRKPPRETDVVG